MSVHFYAAESQPLTRWRDPNLPRRWHVRRNHPRRQMYCYLCGRRRWAKHLRIQVYYDGVHVFCAEGCQRRVQ